MLDIQAKPEPVASCGLYCGPCRAHLKGKCPGCRDNAKASWCKVRTCCHGKGIATCAACGEFADPRQCGKFNNIVASSSASFFAPTAPPALTRSNTSASKATRGRWRSGGGRRSGGGEVGGGWGVSQSGHNLPLRICPDS